MLAAISLIAALTPTGRSLLTAVALVLVVIGIVLCARRQFLAGAALIVLGFLVGPGGLTLFQ